MTLKLTDLQLVLLSSAAARPDGSLLPPPESVGTQLARIRKTIPPLLKRLLVEEVRVTDAAQAWREDGDTRFGVIITAAGRAAIGAKEPSSPIEPAPSEPVTAVDADQDAEAVTSSMDSAETTPPARATKASMVLDLLRREQGATLTELVAATGWLPHTTRAALTGLRKKGHTLDKSKRGEATCYRIAEAA